MKYPEVTSLFKYSPIGKNQLSALSQSKIWYSKPARFNDPFDTKFYVTGRKHTYAPTIPPSTIGKSMNDALVFTKQSLNPQLAKFQQGIEKLGILSLAQSHKNLLMWAHYANDHKGMCIEFTRDSASELTDEEAIRPIHYTDNHPTLSTQSLKSQDSIEASMKRILYAKSEHWKYEQEWRHIIDVGDKLHSWPAPLKAVYFGCKTEPDDIQLVKTVLSNDKIKYMRAKQSESKFSLMFEPV